MTTAAADGARTFRLREVVTDVPRTVWLLTVAFVCLSSCWAFLAPVYRAPDEFAHIDLVYGLRTGDGFALPTERFVDTEVTGSLEYLDFDAAEPRALAPEAAPQRVDRPAFDELQPGYDEMYNWVTSHPPLYYGLEAMWLWATPGSLDWSFDQVVVWLRLSNVLLVAPLPLLAFAVARRLTRSRHVAVAAAAFPLAVPQLLHVSGAVNNDNLLNVLAGLLTLVGLAVAQGDLSRRTAAWAGGVLGLALLTKGFGLVLVGWLGLAYLVGWARRRGPLPWASGLVALGVATAVGGWWWVRNVVLLGVVQPSGAPPPDPVPGPRLPAEDFLVDRFGRWMVERLWGSFGWIDTPIPWAYAAVGVVVVLVGLALAFALPSRRGERRVDLALAPAPAVLALGLLVWASWDYYTSTGVPAGIQGRYLYVGLTGVAAAAMVGYGKLLRGGERFLPLAVLVGAVVMMRTALVTVLSRYWDEPGGPVLEALRAVIAWSPWDGIWLAALWALTAAVAAVVALSMVADALWQPSEDDPGDAAPAASGPTPVGGAHRRP